MIDLHVRVAFSRKARADASIMARVVQPVALAESLARRALDRVRQRGQTATPVSEYAPATARSRGSQRRYVRDPEYAREAKAGAQSHWPSSAAFHAAAGVKIGTFNVTGGMWKGLQVRNIGSSAAVIEFGGSSLGGAIEYGRPEKTASGEIVRVQRRGRVRNRFKASAIWRTKRVNPIQPTEAEKAALGAALAWWVDRAAADVLGARQARFVLGTEDPQAFREAIARLRAHQGGA